MKEKKGRKADNSPLDTIGQRLRELRESKRLTQGDLALVCGISTPAYASWEQGRTMPSIDKLPLLADFYHISTDYLLGVSTEAVNERLASRIVNLSPENQKMMEYIITNFAASEKYHDKHPKNNDEQSTPTE